MKPLSWIVLACVVPLSLLIYSWVESGEPARVVYDRELTTMPDGQELRAENLTPPAMQGPGDPVREPPRQRPEDEERGFRDDDERRGPPHREERRRHRDGEFRRHIGPPNRFWEARIDELRDENPELAELHVQLRETEEMIGEIFDSILELEDAEMREESIARLHELMRIQFDLDLERQRMEVAFMQKRIDRVLEMLERKEEHRDAILERRLHHLEQEYDIPELAEYEVPMEDEYEHDDEEE